MVDVVVVVLRFGWGAIVVVVLVVVVEVVEVVDVSINRNFTSFSSMPRTAVSAGIPHAVIIAAVTATAAIRLARPARPAQLATGTSQFVPFMNLFTIEEAVT
jgi:hypothetical protein